MHYVDFPFFTRIGPGGFAFSPFIRHSHPQVVSPFTPLRCGWVCVGRPHFSMGFCLRRIHFLWLFIRFFFNSDPLHLSSFVRSLLLFTALQQRVSPCAFYDDSLNLVPEPNILFLSTSVSALFLRGVDFHSFFPFPVAKVLRLLLLPDDFNRCWHSNDAPSCLLQPLKFSLSPPGTFTLFLRGLSIRTSFLLPSRPPTSVLWRGSPSASPLYQPPSFP